MNVIQIVGNTGTGKSTLGRLVSLIPDANYKHIFGGSMTTTAIKGLTGSVVLDDVRNEKQIELYLANPKITHLYILTESFIKL